MFQELRRSARSLLRRPGFTALVVGTLAVGLGATVAVYSVVDGVLLSPLPFPEPDRLVWAHETVRRDEVERRTFSYPDFEDLRRETTSFEGLAAHTDLSGVVTGGDRALRVAMEVVSPAYFDVLGVEPVRGRSLLAEAAARPRSAEANAADGTDEVVISHRFWRSHFGGEADVVGREVVVDDRPRQVVGVLPAGFLGLSDEADLFLPFDRLPEDWLADRGDRWHSVVGRLAPGRSLEAAQQEASAVFAALEAEHPESNSDYGVELVTLEEMYFGDLQRPLWVLLMAVALVFAIAVVNVANLLLLRASGERSQTALRKALGAGRGHLLGHGLAQALWLTVAGGVLGLLLAVWGVDVLMVLSPVELPSFVTVAVDGSVLAATLLLVLVTAAALALGTTLRASGASPAEALKASAGGRADAGRAGGRQLLLVAEVALAVVVTVGAGLLLGTWRQLTALDPGYEADSVALFQVSLPSSPEGADREAAAEARRRWHREIQRTLVSAPGVEAAAVAAAAPLSGYRAGLITLEGTVPDPDDTYGGAQRVYHHQVSPSYFETLRLPLLSGRVFGDRDPAGGPGVAVVSATMAERFWPGEDAVGRRFYLGKPKGPEAETAAPDEGGVEWATVIGVVSDAAQRSLVADPVAEPDDPDVYLSAEQVTPGGVTALARVTGDPAALLPTLTRLVGDLDPELAVYEPEVLAERVADETARTRFSTFLLTLLGALALLLAAVGIYGVVAHQVATRTREIGIRMALGADRGRVVGGVVRQALGWTVAGVAVGLVLAKLLTHTLEGLLYQVDAGDPLTFLSGATALVAVAAVASWAPAQRAARVDPARALGGE
jgi:predicted permease